MFINFESYKMLLKSFIFLFWIHSLPVSESCGEVNFFNDSYSFHIDTNFTINLSVSNVSSPFLLKLEPSWDRLKIHQKTFPITGPQTLSATVSTGMQYIYTITAVCEQQNQQTKQLASTSIVVAKSKTESKFQMIFGICMNIFLIFPMFLIGTDLDYKIILSYLKRPVGPVIGICSQFIGMPLASFVIGYIFLRDQPLAQFGLLMIGSSPGGTASNFWTAFFKGDLNLSVTMTFCSSLASFGLSTFWIYILSTQILDDDADITLPYDRIFLAILSLAVPICLGMFFKHKKPELATKIRRLSRPMFLIFILVSLAVGTYLNRSFFSLVEGKHVLVAMLLSASGFVIGSLCAGLARLSRPQIIAVAIETAVQNPSAAFLVMQNMESPYGDIGSLPIICYIGFAIGPPMLVVLIIYKTVEFFRNRGKEPEEKDGESPDTNLKSISKSENEKKMTKGHSGYGTSLENKGYEES